MFHRYRDFWAGLVERVEISRIRLRNANVKIAYLGAD